MRVYVDCFDAVDGATGRVSGLQKFLLKQSQRFLFVKTVVGSALSVDVLGLQA